MSNLGQCYKALSHKICSVPGLSMGMSASIATVRTGLLLPQI